jgi:hypothetical protein
MCRNRCCCCRPCSDSQSTHTLTSVSVPCKVVMTSGQSGAVTVSEAVQTDDNISPTTQVQSTRVLDPNHVCIRCCRPAGIYVENWNQHPPCDPAYPYPEWWPKYDANMDKLCPKPRRRSLLLPRDESLYREATRVLMQHNSTSEAASVGETAQSAPGRILTVIPQEPKVTSSPPADTSVGTEPESKSKKDTQPNYRQATRVVSPTDSTPAKVVIGNVSRAHSSTTNRSVWMSFPSSLVVSALCVSV